MHHNFAIAFFFFASLSLGAAEPAGSSKVSWQPQALVNGTVCLFTVHVNGAPQKVAGKWLGRDLTFTAGADGNWYSLGV